MRIMSFNANGVRSAASKGFFSWFSGQHVDVLCMQETKAQVAQLGDAVFHPSGYAPVFRDASTKKGYSGVAIWSRQAPDAVLTGLGREDFDEEGRYVEVRFGHLSVVSFYIPSGSSGEQRQGYKFSIMQWLGPILDAWLKSGRDYVLCGDWNIVRSSKDIKNWSGNQKNSGCLPEERAWMNALIEAGWIDTYRHLHPDGQDYTWWSNRGQARANNVGWRIDYQLVSPALGKRLRGCGIAREPRFSDHAPYWVDYA